MSVGAGSIKRAAKAAEGSVEATTAENVVETKEVKGGVDLKVSKAVKAAEGGMEENTTKKTASRKPAVKKTSADKKISGAGNSAETCAEAEKSGTAYVAYGVGQELPVHLM